MVHAYIPCIWGVQAQGEVIKSLIIFWLHNDFEAKVGNMRPFLKRTRQFL